MPFSRRVTAFAGLAFLFAGVGPAGAVEVSLSAASISDAIAAGSTMARRGEGYAFGSYVLFSSDDSMSVANEKDGIEAIIVGTPYERLRFEAYLMAHQNKPFGGALAANVAARREGVIDFVLFVHSRIGQGKDFISQYGGATLTDDTGRTLAPEQTFRTTPMNDAYLGIGSSVVTRWLGQITYRFRIDPSTTADGRLTLSFADDRGSTHRYPVPLANYR